MKTVDPSLCYAHIDLGCDVHKACPLTPCSGTLLGAVDGHLGTGLCFLGRGRGLFAQGSAVHPGVGRVWWQPGLPGAAPPPTRAQPAPVAHRRPLL